MSQIKSRIFLGLRFTAMEKIFVQGISVVTFLIIVNSLSLKGFGAFSLLFSIVGIATTFTGIGIEQLVVSDTAAYRAKDRYGHIKRLFFEYLTLAILLTVLVAAVGSMLAGSVNTFFSVDVGNYYWLLVGLIASQTVINVCRSVLKGLEQFVVLFTTSVLESVLRLLAVLSMLYFFDLSLGFVLWAYVISKIASAAYSLSCAVIHLKSYSFGAEVSGIKEILRQHGKWESAMSFVSVVTDKAPVWIINTLISTEMVALYAFAKRVNSIFVKMLPVRNALFPILVNSIKTNRDQAAIIITKAKKYLFIIYGVAYVAVLLLAEPIVSTFLPKYSGVELLVYIAMLRLFVDVYSLGQSPVFYALKQQKLTFMINLVSIPSLLVSQFVGAIMFGVVGMMISARLVILFFAFVREIILVRKFNFPITRWKSLFLFDKYDRLIIAQFKNTLRKFLRMH